MKATELIKSVLHSTKRQDTTCMGIVTLAPGYGWYTGLGSHVPPAYLDRPMKITGYMMSDTYTAFRPWVQPDSTRPGHTKRVADKAKTRMYRNCFITNLNHETYVIDIRDAFYIRTHQELANINPELDRLNKDMVAGYVQY